MPVHVDAIFNSLLGKRIYPGHRGSAFIAACPNFPGHFRLTGDGLILAKPKDAPKAPRLIARKKASSQRVEKRGRRPNASRKEPISPRDRQYARDLTLARNWIPIILSLPEHTLDPTQGFARPDLHAAAQLNGSYSLAQVTTALEHLIRLRYVQRTRAHGRYFLGPPLAATIAARTSSQRSTNRLQAYIMIGDFEEIPRSTHIPGTYHVEIASEAPRHLIDNIAVALVRDAIGEVFGSPYTLIVLDADGARFPKQTPVNQIDDLSLNNWGEFRGCLEDDDLPFDRQISIKAPW